MEALGLLPVVGDVVEILGIGADLLKYGPAGLDLGQVLFALIFAATFWSASTRPDSLANDSSCIAKRMR